MLTSDGVIETVLAEHAGVIGADLTGYRNHVYRVANLCLELSREGGPAPTVDVVTRITTAAVFHDLGIWTAGTFDYLAPSVRLAEAWLETTNRAEWIPETRAMILNHHKITPCRGAHGPLVDAFRQADWIDVTWGAVRGGLPRAFVTGLQRTWPSAGFHARLVALSWQRLRTHPLSPLPMLRV